MTIELINCKCYGEKSKALDVHCQWMSAKYFLFHFLHCLSQFIQSGTQIHSYHLHWKHLQPFLKIMVILTKWAEAIPIPDQSARRITKDLITVFSHYGLPNISYIQTRGVTLKDAIFRLWISMHTSTYYLLQNSNFLNCIWRFVRSNEFSFVQMKVRIQPSLFGP